MTASQVAFVRTAKGHGATEIRAVAQRSLVVLSAIESCLSGIENNREIVSLLADQAQRQSNALRANPPDCFLDENGELAELIAKVSSHARTIQQNAIDIRTRVDEIPVIEDGDGLHDSADAYVETAQRFCEAFEELCETIEIHDSLQSGRSGKSFTSAEDLFASMGF